MTDKGQEVMKPARRGAISSAKQRLSWPTPNTPSGGGNLMSTPKHTGGTDLEGAAELWQTPATDSFRSRGGDRKDEMGLDQQARMLWATPHLPREHDSEHSASTYLDRQTQKQFPTPAARDWRSESGGGGYDESLQSPGRSEPSRHDRTLFPPGPADRERWGAIIRERPDLAPAVEYEVRDVAARVARGVDFTRTDQLRGLGNMVVPQQGSLALLVLLQRSTERD